jgi:hypothetical protein
MRSTASADAAADDAVAANDHYELPLYGQQPQLYEHVTVGMW